MHLHHVQNANNNRQAEEIRVRFHQHALNLVNLSMARPSLLLRGFTESVSHAGVDLELEVGHRLEVNL